MSKKILWFDVETTGLDPQKNDPVQIAGMVEIDGEVMGSFNYHCQPISFENVSPKALEINGLTMEDLKGFKPPAEVKDQLTDFLSGHCDKFAPNDKFYPAGYNARFDVDFLAAWFTKLGDKYLGSWWNWKYIDPLPHLFLADYRGEISLKNYQLKTVCESYGIPLDAHDALSDVRATRTLCVKLGLIGEKANASDS